MKKKRVEPFLVLGPVMLSPVILNVYPSSAWWIDDEVRRVLKHVSTLSLPEYILVDVCFIYKQELLDLYETKDMSMHDMCMYVIECCGDEGGRLCPPQLWSLFASVYMDVKICMPEHVSLIMPEVLLVSDEAPREIGATFLHYNLGWRRCTCGEIEPRFPRLGFAYDCLAYVRVREESKSAIQLPRFQAG